MGVHVSHVYIDVWLFEMQQMYVIHRHAMKNVFGLKYFKRMFQTFLMFQTCFSQKAICIQVLLLLVLKESVAMLVNEYILLLYSRHSEQDVFKFVNEYSSMSIPDIQNKLDQEKTARASAENQLLAAEKEKSGLKVDLLQMTQQVTAVQNELKNEKEKVHSTWL